ncbi:MAG: hypothetical protein WEB78_01255, partial [Ilumatobacteraceae bacterium]
MDTAWPPPDADGDEDDRYPNYRMRRAMVLGAVAVVVALVATIVVRRDSSDDESSRSGVAAWNTVVLQDPTTGAISIHDRSGDLIATGSTDLRGLIDVGAAGSVVVGVQGTPGADGLGVIDLSTGEVEPLDVRGDVVDQVGDAPYLVSSNAEGSVLELIDPIAATVTDLLALAGRDDAIADVASLRTDPELRHIAFTELRGAATVVVPLGTDGDGDGDGDAVSLPGALADMAFGRVLTVTNRGDSVLVDLSGDDGTRVGTVETATPVAMMLVDDSTAIAVTVDGTLSQLDFDGEDVSSRDDLIGVLPVPPGSPSDGTYRLVATGAVLADHTRLALFGDRFVAFLGPDGELVRSVDVAALVEPVLGVDAPDRCLLVAAGASGPITYIDATTGGIITSVTGAAVRGVASDRCTAAIDQRSAADVVVGIGTNVVSRRQVVALSLDGTAVLQAPQPDVGHDDA